MDGERHDEVRCSWPEHHSAGGVSPYAPGTTRVASVALRDHQGTRSIRGPRRAATETLDPLTLGGVWHGRIRDLDGLSSAHDRMAAPRFIGASQSCRRREGPQFAACTLVGEAVSRRHLAHPNCALAQRNFDDERGVRRGHPVNRALGPAG